LKPRLKVGLQGEGKKKKKINRRNIMSDS